MSYGGVPRPSGKMPTANEEVKAPTQTPEEPAQGDGFHHHELHENESGFHSKHTDPSGEIEEADHADYEEAKQAQDAAFGQGDGESDQSQDVISDKPKMSEPNLSEAYSK